MGTLLVARPIPKPTISRPIDEHVQGRRRGADHGAGDENHGRHQEHGAAAENVRQAAAAESRYGGADEHDADHQLLLECAQRKLGANEN